VTDKHTTAPVEAASTATLRAIIPQVADIALEFLDREGGLPGGSQRDPALLARELDLALGEEGIAPDEVMERLRSVLRATPSSSSWRFVNQLFSGREPLAAAAEMLTAVPNNSMYTFKAAGAQVLVENEVLRHILAVTGFLEGEGCFLPGGTLANMVALLLARNRAEPAARNDGASGRKLAIYASAESHYSIPRSAGILGIGRKHVRLVDVDYSGRMDPAALARAIDADRAAGITPAVVAATSGTTVRGSFDPIREIAAVAREAGAWLHVDGAFGGTVLLSETHRRLMDGLELADSFSWDPHKMMGLPLQCSALIVARRGELARSLDESADYLFQADDDHLNPGRRSLLCGRRNDALKLWAAWLHLGDAGWSTRVDRQMELAATAARMIAADPELELAETPQLINVCFEVRSRSSSAVCDRLDREGRLKIGHGIVRGRRKIRLVCANSDLTADHLGRILQEIKEAAAALPPGDNAVAASL
jgi:sulfinoalanine decarboxylase/sulfinoalanine decarboxylase/aspartate 1-decarboxylase